MKRVGNLPTAVNGPRRGICPVCRGRQPIRFTDGKIREHGKNAANPRGCAGSNHAPYKEPRNAGPGTPGVLLPMPRRALEIELRPVDRPPAAS